MKTNSENVNVLIDYRTADDELFTDHLCLPPVFLEREADLRSFYSACYPDRVIEYVWRVVPIS